MVNPAVFWVIGGAPMTPIHRTGGLERRTGRVQAFSINSRRDIGRNRCPGVVTRISGGSGSLGPPPVFWITEGLMLRVRGRPRAQLSGVEP